IDACGRCVDGDSRWSALRDVDIDFRRSLADHDVGRPVAHDCHQMSGVHRAYYNNRSHYRQAESHQNDLTIACARTVFHARKAPRPTEETFPSSASQLLKNEPRGETIRP